MSDRLPLVAVVVEPDDPGPPGLDVLTDRARLEMARTPGELDALVDEASVLAVYDIRTRLLRDAGDRLRGVGWVHAASAGVDAVLTPTVVEGPSVVTNAQGVFDRGIAEYVLALLLVFAKDLHTTLELQRARVWRHRETQPLAGRRLLVVGAGSIGGAVARLAGAAGMHVDGIARRARPDDPDFDTVAEADSLLSLLATADDVVVCAPLTDATRGLFDVAAFAAMKPGARFVNVGRGPIVDEDALLGALRSGQVGAAGLDVFVDEPLPTDHPFWELPNLIVSPHMSGDDEGWREALARQFVANFDRWARGEPLENVVDKRSAFALSTATGAGTP